MPAQENSRCRGIYRWDDAAFIERVRSLARRRNMPLHKLAQEAGVSEAWLRHSPVGSSGRSLNYILRIAEVLQTDPAEIMGLREPGDSALCQVATELSAQLFVALDRRRRGVDACKPENVDQVMTSVSAILDSIERESNAE